MGLNLRIKLGNIIPTNKTIEEKLPNLSEREIEIITLIAKELSTNQIAEKLFLSPAPDGGFSPRQRFYINNYIVPKISYKP